MDEQDLASLARLGSDPRFAARYRLDGPLGRGGMALVARATDLGTGRAVAVKMLCGQFTPEAAERMMREGRLMAQVRHPFVLQVYDLGLAAGVPFLVTELAPRGSLRDALAGGRFGLTRTAAVMGPVCAALACLHDQGIVHRDLKPDNILFGDDLQPRVADFGLATLAGGDRLTETGAFVGSVHYAAPEMLSGEGPSAAADRYAIGVMLYELLAGALPFQARTLSELFRMVQEGTPPNLGDRCPLLPVDVVQAVHACMARAPADRPASAAELARRIATWPGLPPPAVERTQALRRVGAVPRGLAPVTTRTRARRMSWMAGALAVVLSGLVLATAHRPAGPARAFPAALPPAERERLRAAIDVLSAEAQREVGEFTDVLERRAATMMQEGSEPRVADLQRRAGNLRKDALGRLEELATLSGRLPALDHALFTCRLRSEFHFATWCGEQCRRLAADDRSPGQPALDRAGDEAVLEVTRAFQEDVTGVVAQAPAFAAHDGAALAILLDDVRAVARAASMHEWRAGTRPLLRTALASFQRRLAERGPVADAVWRAWRWGERGSFHKADREALAADVRVLGAGFAAVPGNRAALDELLARMAREAAGAASDPPPSPRAGG